MATDLNIRKKVAFIFKDDLIYILIWNKKDDFFVQGKNPAELNSK